MCRPVQREIDDQKTRGNDRVGKRSRTAYKMFRKVLDPEGDNYIQIGNATQVVKLFLDTPRRPTPELQEILNYEKPDDEIVGIVNDYIRTFPSRDVRIMTNDAGVMMTASHLQIPYIPVNERWLLDPESNESEKTIGRLNNEIARLKNTEPSFLVACNSSSDEGIDKLYGQYRTYEALRESQMLNVIEVLKKRFKLVTEFDLSGETQQSVF